MGRPVFVLSSGGRGAEIHMLMPLCNAEGNALVELIFSHALGRGLHHADKLVVVAMFFIQQRGWMPGIETESRFHGISVVGEVVHLLGKFGMKNLVALVERGVIVDIFF